jgi:fumarylacetoacetase
LPASTSLIPPQHTLNAFASLPRATRRAVRLKIREDVLEKRVEQQCLVSLKEVEMLLPMTIGGYSDYYCSIEHVRNVRDGPFMNVSLGKQ